MTQYKQINGYQVAQCLYDFVNQEVIPGTGIDQDEFWDGATQVFSEFSHQNQALLDKRHHLQQQIDDYHRQHNPIESADYQRFLEEIGYLVPGSEKVQIETEGVDEEVATMAGPQLVVPLMNARFALNATNARWGSLYDALYGTDVIDEKDGATRTGGYNPVRGKKVQQKARQLLDQCLPLKEGSHVQASAYKINQQSLEVHLGDQITGLKDEATLVGYQGELDAPEALLFKHNGLHLEIQIDREHPVGKTDVAGVKDILLEAAITTIQDCEDSIAAVDAEDKTAVYRNYLGLMNGQLSDTFEKNGSMMTRTLNADRHYQDLNGKDFSLSGRSLLFIRHVGLLMMTSTVLDPLGNETPEGILDALITGLISLHDLKGLSSFKNSKQGSIYVVKPKLHGPEEVAFTDKLFQQVEQLLKLPKYCIKLGIMDEERRTSLNLKECILAAKNRVVFINTGFLDRTGDEIHTSMLAGPMVRKEAMKDEPWIKAYEDRNVRIGLECGFMGRAQIGKGMWATPDEMAAMMKQKIGHPKAGANTAWVPSPTAATLHALHYHQVLVSQVQHQLLASYESNAEKKEVDALLTLPLLKNTDLAAEDIQNELENNIQGLLGYVVRWVDLGIGCSKVPDIHDIFRMEDRATLRISSQHLCNWLHHDMVSAEQILSTMQRMAVVVDEQNKNEPGYQPMSPDFDNSLAFQAAKDLIFKGEEQPNGYTELLLHQRRKMVKQKCHS